MIFSDLETALITSCRFILDSNILKFFSDLYSFVPSKAVPKDLLMNCKYSPFVFRGADKSCLCRIIHNSKDRFEYLIASLLFLVCFLNFANSESMLIRLLDLSAGFDPSISQTYANAGMEIAGMLFNAFIGFLCGKN